MNKAQQKVEIERLQQWVHDLQSGMYINCVYCGHRYGPDDKVSPTMQQVLYDHITECPKHPLNAAKARIAALEQLLLEITTYITWCRKPDNCVFCRARKVLDHEW